MKLIIIIGACMLLLGCSALQPHWEWNDNVEFFCIKDNVITQEKLTIRSQYIGSGPKSHVSDSTSYWYNGDTDIWSCEDYYLKSNGHHFKPNELNKGLGRCAC